VVALETLIHDHPEWLRLGEVNGMDDRNELLHPPVLSSKKGGGYSVQKVGVLYVAWRRRLE
jgi:hypothetical protein